MYLKQFSYYLTVYLTNHGDLKSETNNKLSMKGILRTLYFSHFFPMKVGSFLISLLNLKLKTEPKFNLDLIN